MKRKIKSKKKIRGFFYFKKYLIVVTLLLFIGIMLQVLPNKTTINPECANSISCINVLSGQYDENAVGEYHGKLIAGPAIASKPYLARDLTTTVLGDTTAESKHIYIDLSRQELYAFENNAMVYSFKVSTGKWGATPIGDFRVWIKLRYTRMTGGNKDLGTYYDLPNVPYTMYFYNDQIPKSRGFGIHGAYWHNNFGHPMSHGCINMKESEVAQLYAWANPPSAGNVTYTSKDNLGTPITIYGTAPKE